MKTALFALVSAAFLLVAPTAHADDQGYINELNADGVPLVAIGGVFRPDAPVDMGHRICDALRTGTTPQQALTRFGWLSQYGPAIVGAAQHNICPDTLH